MASQSRRLLASSAHACVSTCAAWFAFASTPGVAHAALDGRNAVDRAEIDVMKVQHPHALELLEQGEAAMVAGHFAEADARFGEAMTEAKDRALPARRRCQVLTVLGREAEAQHACQVAGATVGSAIDLRAWVGAWLSTPRLLTPAELDRVSALSVRATNLSSSQPWGRAAECDIARRLGDRFMLKECVTELSQMAPNHYETQVARAAAEGFTMTWARVLGWALLAVACIGTMARGAVSRLKSRSVSSGGKLGAAGLVVSVLSLMATPARAEADEASSSAAAAAEADLDAPSRPLGQLSNRFPIDTNNPMAGMPSIEQRNKAPVQFGYWLMDMSVLADNAIKKGDYAGAAKYFEVIVAAVPDRNIGYSKLCRAYLAMNDRDRAMKPCRTALAYRGATIEDHFRYARLVIAKKGKLDPQEIADIDAQVKDLIDSRLESAAYRIACELATRLDDEKRLESCTAGLVKIEPTELGTVSFQWALAVKKGNFEQAESLVTRARDLGMTEEGLVKMQTGMQKLKPVWRLALENIRYVLAGVLVVFGATILALTWRRTTGRRGEQATGVS